MRTLSIAWKDIQIFLKDRGGLIMSFVLPLIFVIVFSYVFSGMSAEDEVVSLPVVNLDAGGEMANELIDGLNRAAGIETQAYQEAAARTDLEGEGIEVALFIPAGFSESVEAGEQVTLLLVSGPSADGSRLEAIRTVVDGVAKDLSLQTQLIAGLEQMGEMMQANPEAGDAFSPERIVGQAESQFQQSKTQPLVAIEKVSPDAILRQREEFNAVGLSVPGTTALFAFLMASTTAMSIYSEKKTGTFRRLLAAPLAKTEVLGGKVVPGFVTVLAQIAVIFAASVFLLPLIGLDRLYLGNDLLALVVLSALVAICSASLGLLLAAIARTGAQIAGIGTVALWIMGAVSGAFLPQFFLGDFLGTIGKITPHYWAISGYTALFVRAQGLAGITTELAALAGFSLAFFAIGLWRFRFDA